MTETELIDRLRESIVLNGPDAWRTNGYLDNAQRMGWKLVPALKRAGEVSAEMIDQRAWLRAIQTHISRLAQLPGPPTEQDLESIVRAAAALKLSADFVRNRWVPTELARLRKRASSNGVNGFGTSDSFAEMADSVIHQPAAVASAFSPASAVLMTASEPVATAVSTAPDLDRQPDVSDVTVPTEVESASVVRSFTAIPNRIRRGESAALAWVVTNLPTVTVDDLGAGLPPQHQGWVKPATTTDYTLFGPDKKPLSTVRVEVIPRDRSVLYGVVGALLLIIGFLWYNNTGKPKTIRRTEQIPAQSRRPARTGAGTVYDTVEGDPDERGWRRARSNGRWGYINQDDQWVIQPEYDVVTQFRNGSAVVFRKGRLITIDRDGKPVRK